MLVPKLENKPTRLSDEREADTGKQSFSEFIRDKRKELQYQVGTGKRREFFPLKTLADNLGISKAVLEGKIYQKPGKGPSRDWVIAISAALGLNSFDTNEALLLCAYPQLDTDLPRDDFLIGYLKEHEGQASTLADINQELLKMNMSPLCADSKNDSDRRKHSLPGSFTIIRRSIKTYEGAGEQYDSLEAAFPFYRCIVSERIRDQSQSEYVLEGATDGDLYVHTEGEPLPRHYKRIEDTGIFADLFIDILSAAKKEQQNIDLQLFDSKNYKGRLGAGFKHDRLHVFYEEFNYAAPERNEYYLMEYVDGHLQLSVSKQSMFMSEYLSAADYQLHYRMLPQKKRIVFESLSEIDERVNNIPPYSYYHDVILERQTTFKRLSKKVADAVDQIKNRTLFVRHLSYIYDNPGDICTFFDIEKEFECTHDNEYGEIMVGKTEATVTADNGTTVTIAFSELARAFELGFESWEQIVRVKAERGSVEDVF